MVVDQVESQGVPRRLAWSKWCQMKVSLDGCLPYSANSESRIYSSQCALPQTSICLQLVIRSLFNFQITILVSGLTAGAIVALFDKQNAHLPGSLHPQVLAGPTSASQLTDQIPFVPDFRWLREIIFPL